MLARQVLNHLPGGYNKFKADCVVTASGTSFMSRSGVRRPTKVVFEKAFAAATLSSGGDQSHWTGSRLGAAAACLPQSEVMQLC
jgi:hypothetical protein